MRSSKPHQRWRTSLVPRRWNNRSENWQSNQQQLCLCLSHQGRRRWSSLYLQAAERSVGVGLRGAECYLWVEGKEAAGLGHLHFVLSDNWSPNLDLATLFNSCPHMKHQNASIFPSPREHQVSASNIEHSTPTLPHACLSSHNVAQASFRFTSSTGWSISVFQNQPLYLAYSTKNEDIHPFVHVMTIHVFSLWDVCPCLIIMFLFGYLYLLFINLYQQQGPVVQGHIMLALLWSLRQEACQLKASLGYMERTYLKNSNNNKNSRDSGCD